MKMLSISFIYISICGAIGFACWVISSAWPLLALMFLPSLSFKDTEYEDWKEIAKKQSDDLTHLIRENEILKEQARSITNEE